jgi:hypothetical protein
MSRRRLSLLLPLAALAISSPSAHAAPKKTARGQQWTISRVELDGVVSLEEEDRGYTGTARYAGPGRAMTPFQLTPGKGAMPHLFTASAPITYEGSSRAAISQLDADWDCSYTMASPYKPETLPIVFAVTAKVVNMHLMVVPAGIRCPDDAPAWSLYIVPEKARMMQFELRRLNGTKVGGTRLLPVDLRGRGSKAGVSYDSRWRGSLTLKRVR